MSSLAKQSRYRLHYQKNNEPANIFKLAVKHGWELLELSPQSETLEQIFMDLVHSESKQEVALQKQGLANE
jgi:hypothetical protein